MAAAGRSRLVAPSGGQRRWPGSCSLSRPRSGRPASCGPSGPNRRSMCAFTWRRSTADPASWSPPGVGRSRRSFLTWPMAWCVLYTWWPTPRSWLACEEPGRCDARTAKRHAKQRFVSCATTIRRGKGSCSVLECHRCGTDHPVPLRLLRPEPPRARHARRGGQVVAGDGVPLVVSTQGGAVRLRLDRQSRPPQPAIPAPEADRLKPGHEFLVFRLVEFEQDRHITGVVLPRAERVFGRTAVSYAVRPPDAGRCRLVVCISVAAPS